MICYQRLDSIEFVNGFNKNAKHKISLPTNHYANANGMLKWVNELIDLRRIERA